MARVEHHRTLEVRPSTTNGAMRDMRKNKFESEASKIVFGNDKNATF
jgi:uncharacterized protein